MPITITTLMENTSNRAPLCAEHGMSFLVDTGSRRILLDVGDSDGFLRNADALGLDLGTADTLVLSHGHYDHTGGVPALIARGILPGQIYLGENFFEPRYSAEDGTLRYIGTNFDEGDFYRAGVRHRVVASSCLRIADEVWLVARFPHVCSFEAPPTTLLRWRAGEYMTDLFPDEIGMVLRTDAGLVLLGGCCHSGFVNICEHVYRVLGARPSVYIGGTHLKDSGEERIRATMEYAREHHIRIGACHCTGAPAAAIFAAGYADFFENHVGDVVTF